MPRVVPSDIVRAIERMFPDIVSNPAAMPGFGVDAVPSLQVIVHLVDAVPFELLALDPAEYADLVACTAALRGAVEMLLSVRTPGGAVVHVRNLDRHPIAMVHDALAICPDEAPATTTAELAFIADQALRESIRLDISAAHGNLAQGEWKGATVLAGSAVEALLLWRLQEHEARNAGAIQRAAVALLATRVLRHDPGPDLEGPTWHLHEYAEVSGQLGLIAPDTLTLVRLTRNFRNLIHPGRVARLGQKCDRAAALTSLSAVEAVGRDVGQPFRP